MEFSTYATPTIVGEIKRHFRDKGWAIRVPRRLQELRIALGRATAELTQSSGRSPTVAELAAHLGLTEDDVLEGLEGAQAYSPPSLDATSDGADGGESSLADTLGEHDLDLEGGRVPRVRSSRCSRRCRRASARILRCASTGT